MIIVGNGSWVSIDFQGVVQCLRQNCGAFWMA
ncbi:hypothetical protein Golax_010282 [Gossypium laxum]|uniref:Uncharacterized protein n=1 Tax=Gossypium laxum TaxID=34288 RepID=A0A7J8ZH00_9ROSI|nr:hypothetical protein [Gossypium laxum]